MGMSVWQLLLIVIVVFVLFGAGRLPNVMGDLGKGIKNLKKGLKEDDNEPLSDDHAMREVKDIEATTLETGDTTIKEEKTKKPKKVVKKTTKKTTRKKPAVNKKKTSS